MKFTLDGSTESPLPHRSRNQAWLHFRMVGLSRGTASVSARPASVGQALRSCLPNRGRWHALNMDVKGVPCALRSTSASPLNLSDAPAVTLRKTRKLYLACDPTAVILLV